jgi:hypothetical protein
VDKEQAMTKPDARVDHQHEADPRNDAAAPKPREDWQEPKLTFVEPKLTSHGPLTSVTGQFFGAFRALP